MLKAYFGYGANSSFFVMGAVTGKKNLEGYPAKLPDFELCIQNLDQVPDVPIPGAPAPISPRELLLKTWDEKFRSYIIRPKKGAVVNGVVWMIDEQDKALIKNWALEPFGWYQGMQVQVLVDAKLVSAITEGLRPGQEIAGLVDGENYPPFLNPPGIYVKVAEDTREQFLRDLSLDEGKSSRVET